jgi:antitoxin YefM
MYTTYKLKANELNDDFLRSVKALFHDKVVEIAICDSLEAEEDETTYLLKNTANSERLLTAINNIDQPQNIVRVDLSEL